MSPALNQASVAMAAAGGGRLQQVGGPFQQWRVQDLVQLIAESGATQVPPRYIRPPHERPSIQLVERGRGVPLIDLAGLVVDDDDGRCINRERIASQIGEACQDWGFFQVVNHGIPSTLMEAARKVTRAFFELPLEKRLKCSLDSLAEHPAGYGRNYDFEGMPLDWVDILKHNISPPPITDKNLWPAVPVEYRDTIDAYGKEVTRLLYTLLAIISQNLGLKPSYLEEAAGEATILLRSNYYPPCPQPDLVTGLIPHSDASILTVLQQEVGVKGLQVLKGDDWFAIEPVDGALVVNVGDMLQLISNGKYQSSTHRSVTNMERSRLSMATFMFAHPETMLCPPGELIGDTQPQIYRWITSKDYMSRLRCQGVGKKHIIQSLRIED